MSVLTQEPEAPAAGYTGVLRILDSTGDTKVQWDKAVPAEVAAARAQFDTLRGQGYAAYSVAGAKKDEVLSEFDPDVETMILAPAMVGG
jgi:hypothetical protein